jgi:tetratricopeptide (TPR) repeat protein/flagellar motor protein MotB
MKHLSKLFLIAALVLPTILVAQISNVFSKIEKNELRAEVSFENFRYEEAAHYYQKALKSTSDSLQLFLKIGDCYRNMNNHEATVEWYSKGMETDSVVHNNVYNLYYGQALIATGDVKNAKKWFNAYHDTDRHSVAGNRIRGIGNFDDFFVSEESWEIAPFVYNSSARDFSPAFYHDGLIFVSNRHSIFNSKKSKEDISQSFLDLYYCKLQEDGTLAHPTHFSAKLNTSYHEGPVSVYNRGESIVFTRNNFHKKEVKKSKGGVNKLQLFFAEKDDHHHWTEVMPFQHNSKQYSNAHPAMNTKGDLMIFASDRPGGFGGTDLYYSKLKNDTAWTEPVNLGKEINTEGEELFPYLIADSKLYFASNGHAGLGGLDVYEADFSTSRVENIKNLGSPINSPADDFGMIMNNSLTKGYFSSNREDYKNDDIYTTEKKAYDFLIDFVDSYTKETVNDVLVYMTSGFADGEFWDYTGKSLMVRSHKNQKEVMHVRSESYFSLNSEFYTDSIAQSMDSSYVFELKRKPDFSQDSIQLIMIGEQVFFAVNGNVYTPHFGKYSFLTDGEHDISLGIEIEEDEIKKLPILLQNKGYKLKLPIIIDHIYYKTNVYKLRDSDKKILAQIENVMKKYGELSLFINSHADSRGSAEYNLKLSENRASAARNFLNDNGIAETRVSVLYFGEFIKETGCTPGLNCTEEDYRQNRKSQFGFFVE